VNLADHSICESLVSYPAGADDVHERHLLAAETERLLFSCLRPKAAGLQSAKRVRKKASGICRGSAAELLPCDLLDQ
jgi:hypothetical protein